jgi:hypothetical protein
MKSPDSSVAIALHCLDLFATVAAIIAAAVVTGSTSNLMAIEQAEAPSRLNKPRLCPISKTLLPTSMAMAWSRFRNW